ncbi:YciI family protein [Nocardia inohanensis]|uniref:YciI family protein n=1 Tax=Nocardia inohanensis TaxID=209246 RepID=UPI00082E7701|nr:YciI family protein [Nocardia inohanensis]
MKFLLNLYLRAAALPGDHFDHERFPAAPGELISAHLFADPSISAVVSVSDGVVTVTEGPYSRTPDYVAGHYLIDCESRERAVELAATLSRDHDAGVEVRPLMDSAGMEM